MENKVDVFEGLIVCNNQFAQLNGRKLWLLTMNGSELRAYDFVGCNASHGSPWRIVGNEVGDVIEMTGGHPARRNLVLRGRLEFESEGENAIAILRSEDGQSHVLDFGEGEESGARRMATEHFSGNFKAGDWIEVRGFSTIQVQAFRGGDQGGSQ